MYVQPVSVLRARQQAAAVVVCVLRKHIGVHLGRQCVPKQVICHAVAEAVVGYAYQFIVIICVADLRVTLRKAGKPVHGVVAVCSHVAVGVGHGDHGVVKGRADMHGALFDRLALTTALDNFLYCFSHLHIPPYFFLFAMVFFGPLRVRALVLVLWP